MKKIKRKRKKHCQDCIQLRQQIQILEQRAQLFRCGDCGTVYSSQMTHDCGIC